MKTAVVSVILVVMLGVMHSTVVEAQHHKVLPEDPYKTLRKTRVYTQGDDAFVVDTQNGETIRIKRDQLSDALSGGYLPADRAQVTELQKAEKQKAKWWTDTEVWLGVVGVVVVLIFWILMFICLYGFCGLSHVSKINNNKEKTPMQHNINLNNPNNPNSNLLTSKPSPVPGSRAAMATLLFGILGLLMFWLPIIGCIPGLIAFVLYNRSNKNITASIGVVCCILSLGLGVPLTCVRLVACSHDPTYKTTPETTYASKPKLVVSKSKPVVSKPSVEAAETFSAEAAKERKTPHGPSASGVLQRQGDSLRAVRNRG